MYMYFIFGAFPSVCNYSLLEYMAVCKYVSISDLPACDSHTQKFFLSSGLLNVLDIDGYQGILFLMDRKCLTFTRTERSLKVPVR